MAWDQLLTLAFSAIAALASVLGVIVAMMKNISEKRAAAAAESTNWSLTINPRESREGCLFMTLRLEDPDINRYQLAALRVKTPRSARLMMSVRNNSGDVNARGRTTYDPDRGSFGRCLAINQRLSANRVLGGSYTGPTDYSTKSFFVELPTKPWFSRSDSTRVVIEVTVEEISASRRIRKVVVKSPHIPWTASNPASTT